MGEVLRTVVWWSALGVVVVWGLMVLWTLWDIESALSAILRELTPVYTLRPGQVVPLRRAKDRPAAPPEGGGSVAGPMGPGDQQPLVAYWRCSTCGRRWLVEDRPLVTTPPPAPLCVNCGSNRAVALTMLPRYDFRELGL